MDLQTGRISENSRWQNGVHEFLEVQHDIVVAKENLNPISLSHAVFYKFYRSIIALTGTAERFQTKQIYGIESFDVPLHHPLIRRDLPILIEPTVQRYYATIIKIIKKLIDEGRPILILCATIEDSKKFAQHIQDEKIDFQLLNEVQEDLEHVIISRAGTPGKVTIATNAAGRGTDIKPTAESLQRGGLHVILTFYPNSKRCEDQAIGRGGRQGQPGSSQIILHKQMKEIIALIGIEAMYISDQEIILRLNNQRDLNENQQALTHLSRAEMEHFLSKLTQTFFESFRIWYAKVEHDDFLEKFSERLCSLKLNPQKTFNFDLLSDNDLIIAKECIRLFTSNAEKQKWKIFLNSVVQRIKTKIITDWTLNFFQQSEEDLRSITDSLENLQKEITYKFNEHKQAWEKYLQPDGSGISVYLKEITTLSLPIK